MALQGSQEMIQQEINPPSHGPYVQVSRQVTHCSELMQKTMNILSPYHHGLHSMKNMFTPTAAA